VWPGHSDVVAAYREEGRIQWQALREALYQACDQDKLFSRMFGRFYDGKTDKDAVVRSFLAHTTALKPLRYALMTYASEPERRRSSTVEQRRNRGNSVLPEKIMSVLPFMQGGMLFLLWSMFPAFLGVTFLLRHAVPLIIFSGVLFSVKAWTMIWVILDKTSTVWFGIYKTWGGFAMWDQPGLNEFITLVAVILPLAMTGAVIFLGSRIKAEGKT